MKLTILSFVLLLFFILHSGFGQVPQVPSSIEIAEVKLKITSGAREKIQKDVNAIRASEKYFRVKLDLINLYFPIIERVLKEEGVPDDIKYLSIQESSLQSDAVSSANAVGYWQFKDFTAREVGLRVDSKVDERKNIVSATRGAAKYFKRNNMFFDHWIYSLNAYMTGPGGAKRYVDKNNFGTGKLTVTENTHWYVLRFIAHVIAYKDEVGGMHSEGLKLVEYTKGANKDLNQIARQFNVDSDLVKDYNKWLSHGKVPDDKTYTVIIPVTGEVAKVAEKTPAPLARHIKEPRQVEYPEKLTEDIGNKKAVLIKVNGIEAVMAGDDDNLVSLSLKVDVPSRKLVRFNDLKPTQQIEGGEIYYIKKKKNRSPIRYHVAGRGESLWDISQKYGVKLKKLAKKNRMAMDDPVKPGRLIWLRKKRPKKTPVEYHDLKKSEPTLRERGPVVKEINPEPSDPVQNAPERLETRLETRLKNKEENSMPAKEPEKTFENQQAEPEEVVVYRYHEVVAGESLWGIANKYGTSLEEIRHWNGLEANSSLHPGQKLRLREDRVKEVILTKSGKSTKEESVHRPHTVVAGESLWSISRKYDISVEDLISWNKLGENTSLSIGQQLQVSASANVPEHKVEKTAGNLGHHEIQPGESLWTVSRRYNVTVEELAAWNGLQPSAVLQPGQKLVINGSQPNPEKPQYVTYTVRGGDSLYKIAKQYNTTVDELMSLNNLRSTALSVGDELKVKAQ